MISNYSAELIRGVLEGCILETRLSTNDEWVSIPDSATAIRYLLECDHPAYCRTKPKPQTVWIACGDSGRLSPPRSTLTSAAQILYAEHGVRAAKSIRLEFEPETFKVVSCTTEGV